MKTTYVNLCSFALRIECPPSPYASERTHDGGAIDLPAPRHPALVMEATAGDSMAGTRALVSVLLPPPVEGTVYIVSSYAALALLALDYGRKDVVTLGRDIVDITPHRRTCVGLVRVRATLAPTDAQHRKARCVSENGIAA